MLEGIAGEGGLEPVEAFDLRWAYSYPDVETLTRAMMAPAGIGQLAGADRRDEVREAIVAGLDGCRQDDGSYRLENCFHFLIARA